MRIRAAESVGTKSDMHTDPTRWPVGETSPEVTCHTPREVRVLIFAIRLSRDLVKNIKFMASSLCWSVTTTILRVAAIDIVIDR